MSVKSKGTKLNIPMLVACVLLCLTMVSVHMTSGLYSRYVSTGEGSDSARVITFGKVTLEEKGTAFNAETGQREKDFTIIPGVDIDKQATVSFSGSEAATYVFVKADLSDNWTGVDTDTDDGIDVIDTFRILSGDIAYLEWQIADGWIYLGKYGGDYVYYKALKPNAKLDKVDLVGNGGKIEVSSQIPTIVLDDTDNTYTANTALNGTYINFHAIAVQANGFESAADAWESVKDK